MGDVIRMRGAGEIIASVGGPVDETEPTLCIYADDLEPEVISRLLGTSPSWSHRKGDVLRGGTPAPTGAWLLEDTSKPTGDLEAQIRGLLARVSADQEVWRQLRRTCTMKMSCMLSIREWSRGLSLSAELLGELAARGLELGLSIYFVGDEDS
jgi:uncharacterized protein DUF4279